MFLVGVFFQQVGVFMFLFVFPKQFICETTRQIIGTTNLSTKVTGQVRNAPVQVRKTFGQIYLALVLTNFFSFRTFFVETFSACS